MVVVDTGGEDAADAASVCEDCGTELELGVGAFAILDVAEDCRTAPELATGSLGILDVAEDCRTALELATESLAMLDAPAATIPSSMSARLGSAHPIVMPD